jgi:hypothetical protein
MLLTPTALPASEPQSPFLDMAAKVIMPFLGNLCDSLLWSSHTIPEMLGSLPPSFETAGWAQPPASPASSTGPCGDDAQQALSLPEQEQPVTFLLATALPPLQPSPNSGVPEAASILSELEDVSSCLSLLLSGRRQNSCLDACSPARVTAPAPSLSPELDATSPSWVSTPAGSPPRVSAPAGSPSRVSTPAPLPDLQAASPPQVNFPTSAPPQDHPSVNMSVPCIEQVWMPAEDVLPLLVAETASVDGHQAQSPLCVYTRRARPQAASTPEPAPQTKQAAEFLNKISRQLPTTLPAPSIPRRR